MTKIRRPLIHTHVKIYAAGIVFDRNILGTLSDYETIKVCRKKSCIFCKIKNQNTFKQNRKHNLVIVCMQQIIFQEVKFVCNLICLIVL